MIHEQTDSFNERVISVRKSQQTIHSRIAMIQLQLFSSRKLTDSNDPFRASLLQWTELTNKNRETVWACAKSKLLLLLYILGLIIVTENHI